MQLNEAVRLLAEFFDRKGIESAKLTAELLICHVLKCKRIDIFLNYDSVLTDGQIVELRKLANRRALREPLQYILGEVEFCGNRLCVCGDVLIPRPETEELVLRVSDLIRPESRILDLGTGSGAIAISLAKLLPNSTIVAVDKNQCAIDVAVKNAEINGVKNIEFFCSNWFSVVSGKFDCIISNPPYLSEGEWCDAAAEVKAFEPKDALVSANGGISDLEYILAEAFEKLSRGGVVALETGIAHKNILNSVASRVGYCKTDVYMDMSGYDRFFFAYVE